MATDQEQPTVTISQKEYDDLKYDQSVLRALESHGVDNWEWYDDAMEDVEE